MRWIRTTSGARMPLDRDPDPRGNVVIERGVARVMRAGEGAQLSLDTLVWLPHFATCPGRARGHATQRRALKRTLERARLEAQADTAVDGVVDAATEQQLRLWAMHEAQAWGRGRR